jgi:hypothetical protein
MDAITKYYGLDWLAVFSGFIAIYLVGNKQKSGLIVYVISAGFSLSFAIIINSIPFIIVNIVTIIMQLQAYRKWSKNN